MKGNQNIDMVSGDSVDITVTLTDAAGQPLDLTGTVLWWGMDEIIKTTGNGIEVGETIVIHLSPADTIELTGPHKHMLRGIDVTGRVETFLSGVVRIADAVFQPVAIATTVRLVA